LSQLNNKLRPKGISRSSRWEGQPRFDTNFVISHILLPSKCLAQCERYFMFDLCLWHFRNILSYREYLWSVMATTRSLPALSLHAAEKASNAARKKAQEIGIGTCKWSPPLSILRYMLTNATLEDMNIALVDTTLHLLHFVRQPNAKLTSIQTAIDKAFTAAGHRNPTSAYKNANFLPGGSAYGIHNTNGGRFTLIGGGIPIMIDGTVVGAIGVSSGTPAQDEEVAKAGAQAIEGLQGRQSKL
jgi:uncharacterized protein GlcG (DUF336 family)